MKNTFDLSLYLVLDPGLCGAYGMVETTRDAVAGGATMIQLRMKEASSQERIEVGRALKQITDGTDTKLIINDDVEAALAIDADGVHVGKADDGPALVRDMLGPDKIVGLSIDGLEIARNFDPTPVDYIGAGPVFATATKPNHAPPVGFEGLAEMIRIAGLPAVAIGGLNATHVEATLAAGADGIAVVSAICGQPDPKEATSTLFQAIQKFKR